MSRKGKAGGTESRRNSDEIAAEIGKTRTELGHTLTALARKLDPSVLLDRLTDMLTRSSATETSNLGGMLRDNALPLGLIGAGIAWLAVDLTRGKAGDREHSEEAAAAGAGDELPSAGASTRAAGADPLLLGVAGLVIGALAGAFLPASRRETEFVADAREDLWKKAEEVGHGMADRIRRAGGGAPPGPADIRD